MQRILAYSGLIQETCGTAETMKKRNGRKKNMQVEHNYRNADLKMVIP